jgi:hypothetical protein
VNRPALLFFLTLSVVSIMMVVAMVQFTTAMIAVPARPSATKWWGLAYALTWAAIIGLFLRGAVATGTSVSRAVALLTLVAVGWATFQAFWIWLWFSLQRTNASATGAGSVGSSHGHTAGWLAVGGLVIVILAVIQLGYIRNLATIIVASGHRPLTATITVAVLGFVLLLVGGVQLVFARGQPMTRAEINEQARSIRYGPQGETDSLTFKKSAYRHLGPAVGSKAEEEVSLTAMKEAGQSGAWLRDPHWRTVFMMTAGGLLMVVGGFGSFVVAGPPVAKILCGGALLYATFQVIAAVRRA